MAVMGQNMQEYYKVTNSYLQILVQLVGSNIVNQPDLSMLPDLISL